MSAAELARLVWSEESGAAGEVLRAVLLPASGLFRLASGVHHSLYDAGLRRTARVDLPVISVGNLRVGGAGKTPFARWVVERLVAMGRRPALLHGGYGSDEPELHRRWYPDVPVIVGRDRAASARAAQAARRDVAVLDDGFQHRRLARDLDIVLLAAEHGVDRMRLLPRGPWREPLTALARAGIVVVTRKTASHERADRVIATVRDRVERRAIHAWIRPDRWTTLQGGAADPPTGAAVAVASTAEPASFFETVGSLGVSLADRLAFPDHHAYGEEDARRILRAAGSRPIVTTEKDAVKLERLVTQADVRVLGQRVTIEDGEAELADRIARAIA